MAQLKFLPLSGVQEFKRRKVSSMHLCLYTLVCTLQHLTIKFTHAKQLQRLTLLATGPQDLEFRKLEHNSVKLRNLLELWPTILNLKPEIPSHILCACAICK